MYRTIDAAFWTDPKVIELDADTRLVFLYLITNPHSHVGGIYHLPVSYISYDIGVSDRLSMRALDTLSGAGLIRFDKEKSVVWVLNMFRYQGRGEKNERAVANLLNSLHGSVLVDEFLSRYPTVQQYLDEPPKPRRAKISNALRFKVLERDSFKCVYCGAGAGSVSIEVDHRVPISQGGTNDLSNLVSACWTCNNGKADTLSGDTLSEVGTPDQDQEQDQEQDQKKEQKQDARRLTEPRNAFGEFQSVLLTEEEYGKLKARMNGTLEPLIDELDRYSQTDPKKFAKSKNHYATLLNWAHRKGLLGKQAVKGELSVSERNQRAAEDAINRHLAKGIRSDVPDVRKDS